MFLSARNSRLGPLATSSSPSSYSQGTSSVTPPPTVLLTAADAAQVNLVSTFLDLLDKAIEEQTGNSTQSSELDADKKKKNGDVVVSEGEICK